MSGDETTPAPTDSQLQALNAFRAPALSDEDLERNVRGSFVEAMVNTSTQTGIHAGPAADALEDELYRILLRQRRIVMELLLRLGEREVRELRQALEHAQDAARGEFPEPAP